ncbi:MAG: hypothetical protein HYS27_06410 [Deltaproteobacteria bacterium]|nr:hypothetical protein [Deltaproteobacteria bacterium]
MLAEDRKTLIAMTLTAADAAWADRGLGAAEQAYQDAARLAQDDGDHLARGRALAGAGQVCRARDQVASAAVFFADAVACFLAAGDDAAAARALAGVTELAADPRALVVHRALAFARSLAPGSSAEGFARAGDEVLRLLKGAAAEPAIDAALSLCTQALSVERAELCARWLVASAGALRALAARGPDPRLARASDLLSRALGHAQVAPTLEAPEAARDQWAFALADLGAELGDRALDELRRLRAHLQRARLLVEAGRAGDALASAKSAFTLARLALGDDDPVTNEALALRTSAQQAAPSARA